MVAAARAAFISSLLAACVLGACGEAMTSSRKEFYTQNAICSQNNCVQPIFPGLNDLGLLEGVAWQCAQHTEVANYIDFCREVVNYDPALPSPNSTSEPLDLVVKRQDDAAATMFFYHLSGLGYEPFEYREPAKSTDECVKSTWSMVCFTYFPKAQAGCQKGEASPYMRPCRNTCEQYVQACSVECCDESVQCVFEHSHEDGSSSQTGYADAAGPSALCTGTVISGSRGRSCSLLVFLAILASHLFGGEASPASSGASSSRRSRPEMTTSQVSLHRFGAKGYSMLLVTLAAIAASLCFQGCDGELPHHNIGNWRRQPDYLVSYEYVPPGGPPVLNSCSEPSLAGPMQCSGRGFCKEFSAKGVISKNAISFCQCDPGWADPECRTQRKSQKTAFALTLFGGFLGADYFYLGFPILGFVKLITLGGFGTWWLVDIVRIGSGPVYGHQYRVAADLPRWVYVLSAVTIFSLAGFAYSMNSFFTYRKNKREAVRKMQEGEEARALASKLDDIEGPRHRLGGGGAGYGSHKVEVRGYGAMMNHPPLPSGGAPYATPMFDANSLGYGRGF